MIARGYPLIQLTQLWHCQYLLQFWLTQQDYLQQLLLSGLQVGQQAQLLKHIRGKILGLVNHQDLMPPGGMSTEQILVNQINQLFNGCIGRMRHAHFIANG